MRGMGRRGRGGGGGSRGQEEECDGLTVEQRRKKKRTYKKCEMVSLDSEDEKDENVTALVEARSKFTNKRIYW